METKKLSIIIPCYNCASTLEEALTSIYTQNLTTPFEIIMVDDGSTDNTKELIISLAKKHKEIKYFFHNKNKGGGATRNTAISKSNGNLIFCLDSDDILGENMLQKMINFLIEKNCDGIIFNESKFFIGKNKNKTTSSFNFINEEPFKIEDLFDNKKGYLTQINFLYTKRAYNITEGYPENHGFDTQELGFKFLVNGLRAFTCPKTFYYHRQALKKSYFERVYSSGTYSLNIYFIMENLIHLFSPSIRTKIINYDIFENSALGKSNLKTMIDLEYSTNKEKIFIQNYEKFLEKDGQQKYISDNKEKNTNDEKFIKAIYFYKNGEYKKAIEIFINMLANNSSCKIIYFNIMRCSVALSGIQKNEIEKETLKNINGLILKKRKIDLNPNIIKKMLLIIKNKLK